MALHAESSDTANARSCSYIHAAKPLLHPLHTCMQCHYPIGTQPAGPEGYILTTRLQGMSRGDCWWWTGPPRLAAYATEGTRPPSRCSRAQILRVDHSAHNTNAHFSSISAWVTMDDGQGWALCAVGAAHQPVCRFNLALNGEGVPAMPSSSTRATPRTCNSPTTA
eukprot:COSAG01_NODE_12246_length_1774_cov_31.748657_1_plen_166_part_00